MMINLVQSKIGLKRDLLLLLIGTSNYP